MPKLAKGGGRVIRANDEGNRAIAQRDQAPNPPDTPGAS